MIYIFQAGICPFCGSVLSKEDMDESVMIKLKLSNNTEMPQPVCLVDRPRLLNILEVRQLFEAIKAHWIGEIRQGRLERQAKEIEIDRIKRLAITGMEVPA